MRPSGAALQLDPSHRSSPERFSDNTLPMLDPVYGFTTRCLQCLLKPGVAFEEVVERRVALLSHHHIFGLEVVDQDLVRAFELLSGEPLTT